MAMIRALPERERCWFPREEVGASVALPLDVSPSSGANTGRNGRFDEGVTVNRDIAPGRRLDRRPSGVVQWSQGSCRRVESPNERQAL
jgi:hypothetical protein